MTNHPNRSNHFGKYSVVQDEDTGAWLLVTPGIGGIEDIISEHNTRDEAVKAAREAVADDRACARIERQERDAEDWAACMHTGADFFDR